MKFNLRQPCSTMCPFHTDCLPGWLGQARAQEISDSLTRHDQTFPCHKTVNYDRRDPASEEHCAGALILIEKTGTANALAQISERLGLRDPDRLNLTAPVFDTFAAFVHHHTSPRVNRG